MIYALNELFKYRFPLRDDSGILISTGSPMVTIKNTQLGTYWNGIEWQDSETFLTLLNLGSGIYGYDIIFETAGSYLIRTIENMRNIDRSFELNIADGMHALIGSTYVISALLTQLGLPVDNLNPTVTILRKSDNTYFDGTNWLSLLSKLSMSDIGEGSYIFEFEYPEVEEFTINVSESTTGYSSTYTLSFSESIHESAMEGFNGVFKISSESILGTDGGDGTIIDSLGSPIKGVIIEVHNKDTKEVFRAVSDSYGKWSLRVPGGTYVLIISHEDYASISIERLVE